MPFSFARMLLGHSGKSTGTLTASASPINEGGAVVFTLPVSGYSNGDTFPYTITGIQSADITQGLTGNMTVSGDNATATINVVADNLTEGGETMTFAADGQNVGVVINDTSTTPITYSVTRNKSSVNENVANPYGGGANASNEVQFTITASSAPSGSVSYSVSGITSGDLTTPSTQPYGSASGGTLTFSGQTATLNFRLWRDYATEGTETLTVTVGGASASVSITDSTISSTVSTTNQVTRAVDYASGGTYFYWGNTNTGATNATGSLAGSSTGYPAYVCIMGIVFYDDDATSSSNIATVSSVTTYSNGGANWTVTNDNYTDNPSPKYRTAFAHIQGSQASGTINPRIIFSRAVNHFRATIWTCYNVHGINPNFIRYQFARGNYGTIRLTPDDTYAPQYLYDHQTGDLALGACIAPGVSNTSTYGTYGQLRSGQNSNYSSFATTDYEGYTNGSDSTDGVFKFGHWGTTSSNNAGLNWRTGNYPVLGYANVNKYYPGANTN